MAHFLENNIFCKYLSHFTVLHKKVCLQQIQIFL